MRLIEFGEPLAAETRLTLFSDNKPTASSGCPTLWTRSAIPTWRSTPTLHYIRFEDEDEDENEEPCEGHEVLDG
jgi:hypothetical protein